MGKHRPVQDRIAEAQAQLAALVAKAASKQTANDPQVQAIDEQIREVQNSVLKFNRWHSEAPDKIANFEARADEWRDRLKTADKARAKASREVASLREKRKALVAKLAAELKVTE